MAAALPVNSFRKSRFDASGAPGVMNGVALAVSAILYLFVPATGVQGLKTLNRLQQCGAP